MENIVSTTVASAPLLYLSATIAAALFFLMTGLRELNRTRREALLYVSLGVLFFAGHFYYLTGLPATTEFGSTSNLGLVWQWLTYIFAPALIALYLLIGLYNFAVTQVKLGLVKIFFGLSLSAFLYWLGQDWAVDVKGILTLIWTIIWFDIHLETAGEAPAVSLSFERHSPSSNG